jgi:polysaccharide pyruvyl transferase WcaK-like protein
MEFGPDGAFAVDLRDDRAADRFLLTHKLEKGRFLCCIPKYRLTPGWKMASKKAPYDAARDARNQQMKEHDHVPLRDAITAVIRQTRMKVLICPEDETEVEIGKEMLYDPLPADVRARVVWRDRFWLTDEALSTYVRSAGLFGNELHSAIMCIGSGVPAIVCRWAEQTSKGLMWRDIGLGDWLFDMDNEQEMQGIVPAVLAMAKGPAKARRKVADAQRIVQSRQRETMRIVAQELRV